mgnify:CR=1 FL=1
MLFFKWVNLSGRKSKSYSTHSTKTRLSKYMVKKIFVSVLTSYHTHYTNSAAILSRTAAELPFLSAVCSLATIITTIRIRITISFCISYRIDLICMPSQAYLIICCRSMSACCSMHFIITTIRLFSVNNITWHL